MKKLIYTKICIRWKGKTTTPFSIEAPSDGDVEKALEAAVTEQLYELLGYGQVTDWEIEELGPRTESGND